jgi:hypothetical protein
MSGILLLVSLAIPLPFVLAGAEPDPGWLVLVVVAFGVYTLGAELWARARKLPGRTASELAAAYRGMFFIQYGLALTPALGGFAVCFIEQRVLPYLIGCAFSLVAMAMAAPTSGEIQRRQEQLNAQGVNVSLGQALTAPHDPAA